MTRNGDISEFKGSTKQAILDMREDIRTVQTDIKSINNKLIVLFLILVVSVVERLPSLISLVMAK